MTDQTINLNIPSEKVTVALEGFLKIYPNNETIDDPEWIDPEDGTTANKIPKYTIKEWVTEKIRRNVVRDIRHGLQMKANEDAQIVSDDSIVEKV